MGVAYVPAAVLLVPGSLLTLGAGFLFGVVEGTIAVSIGSTLGATAAFLSYVVGRAASTLYLTPRVRMALGRHVR